MQLQSLKRNKGKLKGKNLEKVSYDVFILKLIIYNSYLYILNWWNNYTAQSSESESNLPEGFNSVSLVP